MIARKLLLVPVMLLAASAHAQDCFGPVVAGQCHDAQHEMERMRENSREFDDMVRQQREWQRDHEANTSRRQVKAQIAELEARLAQLEAENARLRAEVARLSNR